MRVFVTGATGFVGRALIRVLLDRGDRVTALLLPQEPEDALDGVSIVRGDITVAQTIRGLIAGHDGVVHLAGVVGYGQEWDLCRRVNIAGTDNVAAEARRAGIRRFVHMSSVSVYGRRANVRLDEDAPVRKIGDPYGHTKIDSEAVARRWARDAFELVIVRPGVIYGPGDDRFLPKLVENLRSGRARIIGRGDNTVDLVHVDDVAAFLALTLTEPAASGHVYNLTNPVNCTWHELLETVAAEIGAPCPRQHIPYHLALIVAGAMETVALLTNQQPRLTRYAVRVVGRQYHYDTRRAEQLGFEPSVELRRGIRACLASGERAP
jgi:nucleoside-diphosphate-sugar epimerase